MTEHKCRRCYKELNERGSDNDLEYYDGMCFECYDAIYGIENKEDKT